MSEPNVDHLIVCCYVEPGTVDDGPTPLNSRKHWRDCPGPHYPLALRDSLAEAERALVAEREVSVQVDRAARDWQAKLAEAERERDEAERKESLWRTEWEQVTETARLLSADRNEHAARAIAAESRLTATERELAIANDLCEAVWERAYQEDRDQYDQAFKAWRSARDAALSDNRPKSTHHHCDDHDHACPVSGCTFDNRPEPEAEEL